MKYLVAAFLLAMSIQSFGQFTKGDKVVGASLNLHSYSDATDNEDLDKDKTTHWNITPTFGVMVTENLEVGGLIGYGYDKYKYSRTYSSLQTNKTLSVTPGIYAQKYFPITEKFLFAIKGETSFRIRKQIERRKDDNTNTLTEEETKSSSINLNFEPSLIFFPSTNLAIRGTLGYIGYTHSRNKTTNTRQNSFSASFGSIYLGLHYYFRTKKE